MISSLSDLGIPLNIVLGKAGTRLNGDVSVHLVTTTGITAQEVLEFAIDGKTLITS